MLRKVRGEHPGVCENFDRLRAKLDAIEAGRGETRPKTPQELRDFLTDESALTSRRPRGPLRARSARSRLGPAPLTLYHGTGCRPCPMATSGPVLRIGQVARTAGVNVQTLRYYERRRLLRPPQREPNGYRHYDNDSVRLVRFIKRAQALGFSLREVQALLKLRDTRGVSCAQVRARAETKIGEIAAKERQLAAMRRALEKLVASCRTERSRRDCPILEALAAGEKEQP